MLNKAGLTDDDSDAIVEKINSNQVARIVLAGNGFGDAGAIKIAEALTNNRAVKYISLHNNKIGNAGAQAFAKMLRVNNTLTTLFLSANQFDAASESEIVKANAERPTPMAQSLNGLVLNGC